MTTKLELLTEALTVIADRKGEDNATMTKGIAKVILDKGVEHTPKILAQLNADQIMALVKSAIREATRAVYWRYENIRRTEEEAVRGRGVNGIEHPLDDPRINEEDTPFAQAHEAYEALQELYTSLSPIYQAAAEVVLGWLQDPSRMTLPYYTSLNSDGQTWAEMHTFEDAAIRITSDRIAAREAKQEAAKASLANIANMSF